MKNTKYTYTDEKGSEHIYDENTKTLYTLLYVDEIKGLRLIASPVDNPGDISLILAEKRVAQSLFSALQKKAHRL